MRPRHLLPILKEAASDWIDDGAMRLSSSLAYYAIFSLAPLLVILISMAGLVFGEEAARGQLSQQIALIAGRSAGDAIQAAVKSSAAHSSGGLLATLLSTGLLLFGASTVFAELKDALNHIWGVVVKPGRPFFTLLRDRFLSFSIVLAIGFLLLVSLVISVLLAVLGNYMSVRFELPAAVWRTWDTVISFVVVTTLFALIFKLLPNVRLRWRDMWPGAISTSLLFTLGKFIIGYYLATSSVASSFGAAGSVVIVLAWIYYSACILFFGAEITKSYVKKFGPGIVPNSRGVLVDDLLRARLGISTATITAASTPPELPPEKETPPEEAAKKEAAVAKLLDRRAAKNTQETEQADATNPEPAVNPVNNVIAAGADTIDVIDGTDTDTDTGPTNAADTTEAPPKPPNPSSLKNS